MKFFSPLLLAVLAVSPLFSGCASGPSGGATVQAANRLEVTLSIEKTLDPNFYYGVAFDDIPGDGTGPRALEGTIRSTGLPNGVMGGNWRVLVLFHQNFASPLVYYRSDPSDISTERRVLGTSLLFTTPRVGGNSINFILNLDAQLSPGVYFFTHTAGATPALGVDRFDINYVATNVVITGDDERIKPVDAYEDELISTPFEFQIGSTRRFSYFDPLNDKRINVDPSFSSVNFGQIDVRQLDLSVTRTD
jgi:hypothetical protein